ncbi:nitroreductase family protein [Eubacteriales bacterium OttesenSCG-928-N13]|nr:nitroreductase family protein [Eubacteriales bacterium OttesenSCG-928-N13]
MDLFQAIEARSSYRGMYKSDPVPREDMNKIMQAGLDAPSGCNMQTTSLIGVDDPALIEALGAALAKPNFGSAPAAIAVVTQHIISYGDTCFSVQDYAAAIENMLLAVVALGYASCWVEGYVVNHREVCERMSSILGLPEGHHLVAYLPIGRPAEEDKRATKKAFAERTHFNGFGK